MQSAAKRSLHVDSADGGRIRSIIFPGIGHFQKILNPVNVIRTIRDGRAKIRYGHVPIQIKVLL